MRMNPRADVKVLPAFDLFVFFYLHSSIIDAFYAPALGMMLVAYNGQIVPMCVRYFIHTYVIL